MTNIRDIARLTGYSVSTVSRVLNHQAYVSPATRAAIEKVMTATDYVPNSVARDLSRGQTRNIGVVVPHIQHPFYAALVQGIVSAAFAADYGVTLLQSKYSPQTEQRYLAQLREKAFDALIFTSHTLPLVALQKAAGRVVVCQDPGTVDLPAAYADRLPAYIAALTRLRDAGYARIGVTLPRKPSLSATASITMAAYQAVFHAAPKPGMLYTGAFTDEDGIAAGEYFAKLAHGPQAILANGDDIAAGIVTAYRAAGKTPPPLIGQENQLSSRLLNIPTIDHHIAAVGEAALALATGTKTGQHGIASTLIWRAPASEK